MPTRKAIIDALIGAPIVPPATAWGIDPSGFPIDVTRPIIKNPDGSISTEESVTVEMDGRWWNIPTIVNGQRVDEETAVQDALRRFRAGDQIPNFGSLDEALRAAPQRSRQIGTERATRNLPGGY